MPRRARVTLKDVSNECGYAINTIFARHARR
jgi:hypothetical protein